MAYEIPLRLVQNRYTLIFRDEGHTMALSCRQLIVDKTDHIHRIGIGKFMEMLRDPSRCRFPLFAGQRVRSAEAVVQLVDRKPIRVVRMTFDILIFDRAGCLDTETLKRHQVSRLDFGMIQGALTNEEADTSLIDASAQFSARGGRWTPTRALARGLRDAALNRVKCSHL